MKKVVCIFEDEGIQNFYPLTYTRPVYDLQCGIRSLREKIVDRFPASKIILHSRRYLQEFVREQNPKNLINQFDFDNVLIINGRLLIGEKSLNQIKNLGNDSILLSDDESVVAANLSNVNLHKLYREEFDYLHLDELKNVALVKSQVALLKYPWELVNSNGAEIANDFEFIVKNIPKIDSRKYPSVEFKNKKKIFINKNTVIDPFVFLDATDGPIYIGKNVHIMSHSYIQGPAYIGAGSIIKKGGTIYRNTSIGEVCKVGGEIASSIIQSLSNKQHDGFLGHSYLGSWINIGADTNNSDLKNNYENITVLLNGKPVNTNSQFVGLIMGDHSKTAINTMFNTGTIVGVSCNIFGAGFPPRYIPSFSWGGSDFLKPNDIEKSLEVAKIVMKRRGTDLTLAEESLLRNVFESTAEERSRKMK